MRLFPHKQGTLNYSGLHTCRKPLPFGRCRMAQEQSSKANPLKVRRWNTDEVFLMLKEPVRQQILRALFAGEGKTAMDLNSASGKTRHAYLKHLNAMFDAGFLVKRKNSDDGRQPLYALA